VEGSEEKGGETENEDVIAPPCSGDVIEVHDLFGGGGGGKKKTLQRKKEKEEGVRAATVLIVVPSPRWGGERGEGDQGR